MSDEAEVLRVGHEEHNILKPRQLFDRERCAFGGHDLFLVKTDGGTFVVCDECPSATLRPDLETPEES